MLTYSEIDIQVSASGDLTMAPNGDLAMAAPSGVIKQDIAFRMRTSYDDFTPHPDIGAGLDSLIGEPNSRVTVVKGEDQIIHSLTQDSRIPKSDLIVKGVPISLSNVVYYVFIRDGQNVLNVTPDMSLDLNNGTIAY